MHLYTRWYPTASLRIHLINAKRWLPTASIVDDTSNEQQTLIHPLIQAYFCTGRAFNISLKDVHVSEYDASGMCLRHYTVSYRAIARL